MAPRARRDLADRAALAAQLQYGPQTSALGQLLQMAQSEFESGVAASRTSAQGVARSARGAIRPSRRDFRAARSRVADRRQTAVQGMEELGAAADPYKAAMLGESALAAQLAQQEQTATVNELRGRAVQARQGAAYDERALRGELQANTLDIGRQLMALAQQQGASQSSIYQDLLDAAGDRAIERAGLRQRGAALRETARHNRENERIDWAGENRQAAEDRRDARRRRGPDWLTPSQQNDEFGAVERARSYIRQLEGAGLGSGTVRDVLLRGRRTERSEIPAFDKDIINAAYDLEELGYLSRPNVDALHRRGLRIGNRYPIWRRVPRAVRDAQRTAEEVEQLGRQLAGL